MEMNVLHEVANRIVDFVRTELDLPVPEDEKIAKVIISNILHSSALEINMFDENVIDLLSASLPEEVKDLVGTLYVDML